MKKRQRGIFRCLCALLLVGVLLCVWALPAYAEEGGGSTYTDAEPGGDEEPGGEDPGSEPGGEDPGSEPGNDDPSSEPGGDDDPSSVPGDDDPSSVPGDDDPSSEPGDDDPTPPPEDTPTPEPTDDPVTVEPSGNDNNNTGGTTTRAPRGTGTDIVQPSFSPRSTAPPIGSSQVSEVDPADKEPRYVTFARVTQRTNSMSRVLFYSGASCIGVGGLGLLVLLIFIIRNRRIDARNERIFEEIAQAETRQPVSAGGRGYTQEEYQDYAEGAYDEYAGEYVDDYAQPPMQGETTGDGQGYFQPQAGYGAPQPGMYSPEPESLTVPMNGSLYTEEFEIPQQVRQPAEPSYQELPPQRPARQDRSAQAPPRASMYTEEFALPEEMAQPVPPQRSRPQPSQPQSQPATYDTAELLREILHGDDQ